jgi:hypothetical protein
MPQFVYIDGGVTPLTFSFVDSAINTNVAAITIPVTAQADDLAVLCQQASTQATTPVTPSGFTNIANVNGTTAPTLRHMVDYKVLSAGDISGGSITGMDGSADWKTLLIFRPNRAIVSLSVVSLTAICSDTGDPGAQTITPTAAGILIGYTGATATGTAPSGTLVTNGTLVGNPGTAVQRTYYEIQNSSPASRTLDMPDNGNSNACVTFALQGT